MLYAANEVSNGLGQDLATFVDQGGHLVTDATIGWWMARGYGYGDLNSYVAIDATQNRFGGPATITWTLPAHPLLAGVGSVTIPWYLDNAGVVDPGATLVGTFGSAAVATWRPSGAGAVTSFGFNLTPYRAGVFDLGIPFAASDVVPLVANALQGSIGFGASSSGVCPGTGTLSAAGGTPNGPIAVVTGSGLGAFDVPAGPCFGTTLPIVGARLRVQATMDAAGSWSTTRNFGGALCGKPVVFLDLTTCEFAATSVP